MSAPLHAVTIGRVLLLLLASPAFASRPPADLDLSQPAPKPKRVFG